MERGVELTIRGRVFRLEASPRAANEFQAISGKSFLEIDGSSLTQVLTLAFCFAKAAGTDLTLNEFISFFEPEDLFLVIEALGRAVKSMESPPVRPGGGGCVN